MAIRGVIMAGGEGTRLRPMTLDRPKPLVPILGQPVMGYALSLLRRHGIKEAAATICYLPRMMKEAFGRGERYGVMLTYVEETVPRGTAGSVRLMKGMLNDTFVILSGDGLTDCDLTKALAFHREKKALATLVLKSVPVPLPYGVVITDKLGRILRFVEKPDWSQVFSDLVNTGIYILEPEVLDLIPEDGTYDFGRELFPRMVRENMAVYGYPMEGYWCDIGDQNAYLKAQLDLLAGKINLPVEGSWQGQALLKEGALVEEGVRIEGPCFIGEKAWVGRGAVLREGTVIGPRCRVFEGARLERSCLWEDAQAGRCTSLRGAVLCRESRAEHGAVMEEDTALGTGARLAAHGRMLAGTKIWPERCSVPGAVVRENVVWGSLTGLKLMGDKLILASAAQADVLAGALLEALKPKRTALMGAGEEEPLLAALAGALMTRGGDVALAGKGTPPMLRALQRMTGAESAVYFSGQELRVWGKNGLPLSKAQIKDLETQALRQDYPPPFFCLGQPVRVSGAEVLYMERMMEDWKGRLHSGCLHAAVFCESPAVLHLAGQALKEAGVQDLRLENAPPTALGVKPVKSWETGFLLDATGENAWVLDRDGMPGSLEQSLLYYRALLFQRPSAVFLAADAPRGAWEMLKDYPNVLSMDQCGRDPDAYLRQYEAEHDGILKTLMLLALLEEGSQSLKSLMDGLPKGCRVTRMVPCPPEEKGRVLREMSEKAKHKEMTEGLRILVGDGSALVTPLPHRAAFRVTGECWDAEFAKEICGHFAKKVSALAGRTDKAAHPVFMKKEKNDGPETWNNS